MDALRTPVMFVLKDLMQDLVKGRYYKEQLRKAPTPGKDFNFEVLNILYFYDNINYFNLINLIKKISLLT